MAIRAGRPQLECSEAARTCKVLNPSLTGWTEVIDDSLRLRTGVNARGPLPRLAFSPDPFLQEIGERLVFCPRPDVLLMHLSHPMLQRALSALTRRRFPGTGDTVSRWTVREGGVPPGADALVLLSVEELAINDLRETFHHWVRTIAFPISKGSLGGALKHRPAMELRPAPSANGHQHHAHARDLLDEVMPDLKKFLVEHAGNLTSSLKSQLVSAGVQARTDEEERYRSRQGEVSALITENTLAKIEREIEKLKVERQQGLLFDGEARLDAIDRSIEEKQEVMARRTAAKSALASVLQVPDIESAFGLPVRMPITTAEQGGTTEEVHDPSSNFNDGSSNCTT
jgi:hypothetical protein